MTHTVRVGDWVRFRDSVGDWKPWERVIVVLLQKGGCVLSTAAREGYMQVFVPEGVEVSKKLADHHDWSGGRMGDSECVQCGAWAAGYRAPPEGVCTVLARCPSSTA